MSKFSRVARYEDLRNRLHNDVDNEIKSNDLSDFANKLNKIDSNSFKFLFNLYNSLRRTCNRFIFLT